MGYAEQTLISGEQIVHKAKRHWMLIVLATLGGLAICGVGVIVLLPLGLIDFLTSEFVITNKRVIIKAGLIRKTTLELLLNKVESFSVGQGIIGRIFGFGTVRVNGTGSSFAQFGYIAHPLEFRKQLQAQIDNLAKA
jgi:uncharacterized membrane protein YdbT with pleckstrin-like domain